MNTQRPSDSSKISFSRECFIIEGFETKYHVIQSSLHSAPEIFGNLVDAQEFARIRKAYIQTVTTPISKRVKWF